MIEKLTDEEFNIFSKEHPCNTFFQCSYWGEVKQSNGWIPHLVGLKENNKIVAASLLLQKKIPGIGKSMFYSPRGFLIDYENNSLLKKYTREISSYVKKNGGIFFKINPYLIYQERDVNGDIVMSGKENKKIVKALEDLGFTHNGFTITYGTDLEPRWLSVLDLEEKSEEIILKNLRATTRAAVKNSYKHGLTLTEIDKTRMNEFKELMQHTGERRGFIDRPLSYYEKMYDAFHESGNIKIMLVELNIEQYLSELNKDKDELNCKIDEVKDSTGAKGKRQYKEYLVELERLQVRINELETIHIEKGSNLVLAGGLFMLFGNQLISLFGASYKEYMKFNGQYFLNFEMIKYALEHGYKKYNFFGITGEFNEDSKMFGLFDFKRGWNANVVELIGEFNYITSPYYYQLYKGLFFIYRKIKKWRNK